MDILALLAVFLLLAAVIKIATDNVAAVMKPWVDLKPYRLLIALVLTGGAIAGLNTGVLAALGIPRETSYTWFHEFDLALTTLFLTSGAQAIHKLADMTRETRRKGGG